MVEEYGDDGERAQAVEAGPVRQPYFGGTRRCNGTSVASLVAGRGVGYYLRLSQRTFNGFPPSDCGEMILAQSRAAMQGLADRIVLYVVLFARLFPLFGARLVAHVGGAGEALLIAPVEILDV